MGGYLTVLGISGGEYTEKRSRFIATAAPCANEDEAVKFINEIRGRCWDARHNCYAYCVNEGRTSRFSDDSEPHGTAGAPIMDVIKGAGLVNVAVVVTRYFGGVLLGTGGLVRAYSTAASEALKNARIVRMAEGAVYTLTCEYQDYARLIKILKDYNGDIKNEEFAENVKLTYELENGKSEGLGLKITEVFSGRMVPEKGAAVVIPSDAEEIT